jgi:hypothetical protein
MAFFTIFVPPGLSRRDHRRAVGLGPRAVGSNRAPFELVAAAGFIVVDQIDVTEEFLETVRRWLRFSRDFDEQMADRTDMVEAIESGLLKRALLVAVTPWA